MRDPLYRHLVDIVSDPASRFLILAGGYGMVLKQAHLAKVKTRTLMADLPAVRATADLDFFVRLEMFVTSEGRTVRQLLDRLEYREEMPKFHFVKPMGGESPEAVMKVDLLARGPEPGSEVRAKGPRVGSGSDVGVHGRLTEEAFAVEDSPVMLTLEDVEPQRIVHVPHPFPWTIMKTTATADWLRQQRGEIPVRPYREKHAYDVYVLVAMLTPEELGAGAGFLGRHRDHPHLARAQTQARELFGGRDAPGFAEACRQAGRELDFATFWEAYSQFLGL